MISEIEGKAPERDSDEVINDDGACNRKFASCFPAFLRDQLSAASVQDFFVCHYLSLTVNATHIAA